MATCNVDVALMLRVIVKKLPARTRIHESCKVGAAKGLHVDCLWSGGRNNCDKVEARELNVLVRFDRFASDT